MFIEIDEQLARDLFMALSAYAKATLEASKSSDDGIDMLPAVKTAISVSEFAVSLAKKMES